MSESNESQNQLDFDLRTRIAAVLYQRFATAIGFADADWEHTEHETWLEDADAVIDELKKLCIEWRADFGYDGYAKCTSRDEAKAQVDEFNAALGDDIRDGENAIIMRRYVTEWKADDE